MLHRLIHVLSSPHTCSVYITYCIYGWAGSGGGGGRIGAIGSSPNNDFK